jgi:drug/metabolite transporter (DMT)-like permease
MITGLMALMCVGTFVSYNCWDYAISKGNLVIVSLLADFIPWISILGAAMIVGSELSRDTIISAIILVIGAIITRFSTKALVI